MAQYHILKTSSSYKLEEQVNEYLNRDYKLVGRPFYLDGGPYWCQAVYRETIFDSNGEAIPEFRGFDMKKSPNDRVTSVETKHHITPEQAYDSTTPDWLKNNG